MNYNIVFIAISFAVFAILVSAVVISALDNNLECSPNLLGSDTDMTIAVSGIIASVFLIAGTVFSLLDKQSNHRLVLSVCFPVLAFVCLIAISLDFNIMNGYTSKSTIDEIKACGDLRKASLVAKAIPALVCIILFFWVIFKKMPSDKLSTIPTSVPSSTSAFGRYLRFR